MSSLAVPAGRFARTCLIAATALLLLLTLLSPPPVAAADGSTRGGLDADDLQPAEVETSQSLPRTAVGDLGRGDEPRTYLIRLRDPAVPSYRGGVAGLEATSPDGAERLEADSQPVREYRDHLEATQVAFAGRMDRTTGRDVEVPFTYQFAVNGMAAVLTPEEAREVARDPEVLSIALDEERELHTDSGPSWIGADEVWDEGGGAPIGAEPCVGACGEGIVIGTIDTGISPGNDSFAETGDDGYTHTNPLGDGVFLGACDPADAQFDEDFPCNNKLIGAYVFGGANDSAVDYDGHGSHTASTSGGNVVNDVVVETESDPAFTTPPFDIAGVAPHANIIAYLGCCTLSGLTASIDQAIVDEVDVINYSIGSDAPSALWDDFDSVGFLNARAAGIIVATSNGNNGPGDATTGSPADAPWIISVGASTHNRHNGNALIDLTSSEGTLLDIEGKSTTASLGATPIVHASEAGDPMCLDDSGHDDVFTGHIVVCDRGVNGRVEKSQNVAAQGALGYVLINDEPNGPSLLGDEYAVPGVFISFDDGQALLTWLANGATDHIGAIAGTTFDDTNPARGDILASFSSRGPNRAVDVIVPDVTAPGVDILAALGADSYDSNIHGFISGTSMSSPHTAGAAALIRQARLDWTPAQVQSALMTTADSSVLNHDGTDATPYQQGAGRIDVPAAIAAGLLFDETAADYLASNPAEGGDPKTLNIPSFANSQCLVTCSWQRTATAAGTSPDVTWTASHVSDAGLDLTVDLSPATVSPGDTMTISVNADVSAGTEGETHFGRITLTPSDSSIPAVTMPVAVVPSSGVLPGAVDITTRRDTGSQLAEDLQAIEITDFTASVSGLAQADLTDMELLQDSVRDDMYDDLSDGVAFVTVEVGADARTLIAEITESEAPDLDLFVGTGDTPSLATEVCRSTSPSAAERCDIPDPASGTWWVLVQNWGGSADQPDALTLATAVVPYADLGNASVEGPETQTVGEPFDIRVFWDLDDAEAGDRFYGTIDLGSSPGTPGDIGSIPVTLSRVADDVTKVAEVDTAEVGDTVTYTLEVAPNVTPEDLTYTITDTIPDGMTYVPGSLTGEDATFDDGVITWTPTMPTAVGVAGGYNITTSPRDPDCVNPFSGVAEYIDPRDLNATLAPNPGITGDTTVFTLNNPAPGAPFEYLGRPYASLSFTDDGFIMFDPASNYGGTPFFPQEVPDPQLPNNLLALLWDDYQIVYEEATDTGVTLASTGTSAFDLSLIDYGNLPLWGNPDPDFSQAVTMQVYAFRSASDVPGEYEFYVAYGGLNDLDRDVTVGWEDSTGLNGDALVNEAPATAVGVDTVVCYDYEGPNFDPAIITYQVTVDAGVPDTDLTNIVEHITDNPGDAIATTAATVTVGPAANTAPVGDAGGPYTVDAGDDIQLDGTASTDPDGDTITYDWDSDVGTFDDDTLAEPTLTVPAGTAPDDYTITLTVSDGDLDHDDTTTLTVEAAGGGGGGGTPGGVPQVSVTADDDSFTFTRTGGATDEMIAAYDVGGTAEPGEDYTELSGLVTFDAGSATATVDVDVLAGATEGATIEVTVVDGDVYDVGSPSSATITIGESQTPPAGEDETTVLAGATRIQTAIAISQNAFPEDGSADAVILARADVPFDALAATPLAPDKNGPLLLTDVADLHADTAAEIGRVMADGGTVYVLGGTAALSADVETALTGAGYDVQRIFGPTRYETALAVADEIGEPDAILIASGQQFPDALSAGAAAAAGGLVLLTPEDAPHDAVTAYVAARSETPVYAIGGPAAAVFSDATPIVGSGREATSVMVAEEFFDGPTMVGLARGDEFADALTGGAHAALQGGPVTLTPSTLLHPEVETYLCANSDTLSTGFVYGGDAAIQSGVVDAFTARLAGEGCAA